MQHILVLRAISGAGKSTFVKAFLKQNRDYVVISRDSIRDMFQDRSNSPQTESKVTKIYNAAFREALLNKYNIILDNTHTRPAAISDALKIIQTVNPLANVELKQFDYDVETCIERDSKREHKVGREVIEKQHNIMVQNPQKNIERLINEWKQEMRSKPPIVEKQYDASLPDCILYDIDGTVALKKSDRGYYDWKRVGEDSPNVMVINMINMLDLYRQAHDPDLRIIAVSGRDGICEPETREWLILNNVPYDNLYMRKQGDGRSDVIIKKEIYDAHINEKYNVVAVFDDRRSVSIQWFLMGLPLFRVGHPDDNF
jgi:predicted kinase